MVRANLTTILKSGFSKYLAGMFLYARLVLDYLAANIFYSGDEMKTSVNQLPEKLNDLWVSSQLFY